MAQRQARLADARRLEQAGLPAPGPGHEQAGFRLRGPKPPTGGGLGVRLRERDIAATAESLAFPKSQPTGLRESLRPPPNSRRLLEALEISKSRAPTTRAAEDPYQPPLPTNEFHNKPPQSRVPPHPSAVESQDSQLSTPNSQPVWRGKDAIIGDSPPLLAVLEQVKQVARTNLAVLLQGESGTGKELVARALHRASRRASMPFVTVDSGALPEALIETELFGYEKGAFTGAEERHPGKFEIASGGTLFLDEVSNLAPATQAKLLRALDRKEIYRLGGVRPLQADVRIIAATNRDLEEALREGAFRLDLFFRLNEFPIRLPPLRERGGDILLLAKYFLDMARKELRRDVRVFSEGALACLLSHPWPGNVRELKNAVARAAVMADAIIEPGHLPFTRGSGQSPVASGQRQGQNEEAAEAGQSKTGSSLAPRLPLLDLKTISEQAAREAQRTAILIALERCRGNKTRAARLLHVDYKTLLSKIKKLEL